MPNILVLFIAAALTTPEVPPSPQMRIAIKAKLSDVLLDGQSARYRWPKEHTNDVAYCGFVNAKNSFGAYIGFLPFYALGFHVKKAKVPSVYSVLKAEVDSATADDSSVVAKVCAKAGFDLSVLPPD